MPSSLAPTHTAPSACGTRLATGIATVVMGLAAGNAVAQQTPGVPDISGAWVRVDTTGSGSFDQLAAGYKPASVVPAIAKMLEERARRPQTGAWDPNRRYENGEAYIVTAGTCGFPGGIEPNSSAFHIVQHRDEVVIVRENPGLARNIYMDGRPHPSLGRFVPNVTGHSVGRYEDGALVFETIGLTEGPVPAGGWRTPETRLVERYSVSPDGQRLTLRYTFTDPKIYLEPHSYELVAERGLPAQMAFEWWCDASDPRQSQGVAPPKQE